MDGFEQLPAAALDLLKNWNEGFQMTLTRVLDQKFGVAQDVIDRRSQLMPEVCQGFVVLRFPLGRGLNAQSFSFSRRSIFSSKRGNSIGLVS